MNIRSMYQVLLIKIMKLYVLAILHYNYFGSVSLISIRDSQTSLTLKCAL